MKKCVIIIERRVRVLTIRPDLAVSVPTDFLKKPIAVCAIEVFVQLFAAMTWNLSTSKQSFYILSRC